jgi:predicted DNA-binding transcriptional regulator YafY
MRTTSTTDRDSLGYRLAHILGKLNEGKKLDPQSLADEFNVNLRTIQRDLNERFSFLPLNKSDGHYQIDPTFLGKLSLSDVAQFASLAGVRGLFPSLSDDFLRDVFDSRIQGALLVKGHRYEDLEGKTHNFQQLEQAILARNKVTYSYQKPEGVKTYTDAEPYKLVNHGGIWYLAAKDGDRLKSFSFTKIGRLQISDATFTADPEVEKTLQAEDDIWLNDKKIEVVLKISGVIAGYFKRRKLVASQVIEKELEDGGLIISAKVAHINQILPTVRYWIPNIRIISPEGLQAEMQNEIQTYLAVQ